MGALMKDIIIGVALTVTFIGGVVGTYYGIIEDRSLWWAFFGGVSIGLYSALVRING
jgi:hypothetical protein